MPSLESNGPNASFATYSAQLTLARRSSLLEEPERVRRPSARCLECLGCPGWTKSPMPLQLTNNVEGSLRHYYDRHKEQGDDR